MSSDETSKLTESVPEGLLVDDSVEVYLSDGEKIVSQYSVATELKNPYDFDRYNTVHV